MKYPREVPFWMIESVYGSLASENRGYCVAKTMSIGIYDPEGPSFTGGHPDITPAHSYNNKYISLQDFIDRCAHGS